MSDGYYTSPTHCRPMKSATRVLLPLGLVINIFRAGVILYGVHHILCSYPSQEDITFALPRGLEDERTKESMKACVITISPWNNYGFVSTLYDSLKESNPQNDCFVWYVADRDVISNDVDADKIKQIKSEASFSIVTIDQVGARTANYYTIQRAAFMFGASELVMAFKPFTIKYTFEVLGASSVIYLDHDIWVLDSLKEVEDHLESKSIVVTPRRIEACPTSRVYDLRFVGFRNTAHTIEFLDWWGKRQCQYGPLISDEWTNFISVFFEQTDCHVIRDPRYIVESWNDEQSSVVSREIVLFHGNGPNIIQKVGPTFTTQGSYTISDDSSGLGELMGAYVAKLSNHRFLDYGSISSRFQNFTASDVEIEPWMRLRYLDMVYRDHVNDETDSKFLLAVHSPYDIVSRSRVSKALFREQVHPDPFCTSLDKCQGETGTAKKYVLTYLEWLMSGPHHMAMNMEGRFYYSDIMHHVWQGRTDLQEVFKDPTGSSYAAFSDWFETYALRENMVSKGIYERWRATRDYHRSHHWEFHRQVSSVTDVGVNVFSWHLATFGLALAGVNLVNALRSIDGKVSAIHRFELDNKSYLRTTGIPYQLSRSCLEAVNLFVFLEGKTEVPEVVTKTKYTIAWMYWELDQIPGSWVRALADYDEVWLPSQFVLDAVRQTPGYDGTPLKVLPVPIERPTKQPLVSSPAELPWESPFSIPSDAFLFLVVFDFHSTVQRKNPMAAIRAFRSAFPISEDEDHKYRLMVKSVCGTTVELQDLKSFAHNDPRIQFISDTLPEQEIKYLHHRADCYVSLHRSEGYGMNIVESMMDGVPVIATNYSGNVDFFGAVTEFLDTCHFAIPYKLVRLEESYGPYGEGNHWADADHEFAVKAMRTVVQNDCKVRHGQRMTEAVYAQFGMEAVGRKVQEHLAQSFPLIQAKQTKGS